MDNIKERIVAGSIQNEDLDNEITLRPRWLKEYIGQDKTKEKLNIFIKAAKERKEPLDHVLLSGPPWLR